LGIPGRSNCADTREKQSRKRLPRASPDVEKDGRFLFVAQEAEKKCTSKNQQCGDESEVLGAMAKLRRDPTEYSFAALRIESQAKRKQHKGPQDAVDIAAITSSINCRHCGDQRDDPPGAGGIEFQTQGESVAHQKEQSKIPHSKEGHSARPRCHERGVKSFNNRGKEA